MDILFIVSPVILFFLGVYGAQAGHGRVGAWLSRQATSSRRIAIAAAVVALASLLMLFLAISHPGPWRDYVQLAWTGVEAGSGTHTLVIGGDRSGSTLAWPQGRFSPKLTLSPGSPGMVRLQVERADAFVYLSADDNKYLNGANKYLNGSPLRKPMGAFTWGDFHLECTDLDHNQCEFVLQKTTGEVLTQQPIKVRAGADPRAISLFELVQPDVIRLYTDSNKKSTARELEDWSRKVYLLLARDTVLVVDNEMTAIEEVPVGSMVTIRWPGMRLRARDELTDLGEPRMSFQAPFRHGSPLPPLSNGPTDVQIAPHALPGQNVFLIPLGDELANWTSTVQVEGTHFKVQGPAPVEHKTLPFEPLDAETSGGPAKITSVPVAQWRLWFEILSSIPRPTSLAWPVLLAFCLFVLAATLTLSRIETPVSKAVVAGIALSLWVVLCLRLMLAYRYILDPATVGRLAVTGMYLSLLGLTLLPAVFLYVIYIWRSFYELDIPGPERLKLWGFGLVLSAAPFVQQFLTIRLLPDLPTVYYSNIKSFAFIAALSALVLTLQGFLAGRQSVRQFQAEKLSWGERIAITHWVNYVRKLAARWWSKTATGPQFQMAGRHWLDLTFIGRIFLGVGLLLTVLITEYVLIKLGPKSAEVPVHELGSAPLIVLLVGFWLSSRQSKFGSEGGSFPHRVLLWVAIGLVFGFLPTVGFPLAAHDPGGILAMLAFVAPAALLLLLRRPRAAGWALATSVLLVVSVSIVFLVDAEDLVNFKILGNSGVRLLNYQLGKQTTAAEIWATVYQPEGTKRELGTAQRIADAEEHIWENQAMAYNGGPGGAGFGQAPNRLSSVPQDTLQSDSTYSFYIASEHGFLGGVCLILLYALPLLFALLGTRQREYSFGNAFAIVITAGFLLEAIVHIFVNLEILPFTGRTLPLLSVNSGSDIWRWLFLFPAAGVGMFLPLMSAPPFFPERRDPRSLAQPRYWRNLTMVCVLAIVLLAATPAIWFSYEYFFKPKNLSVHDLSPLIERVSQYIGDDRIKFKPQKGLYAEGLSLRSNSLLWQEIERFNSVYESERLATGTTSNAQLEGELRGVKSREEYLDLLRKLRNGTPVRRGQPLLFQVMPPDEFADYGHQAAATDEAYTVRVNPAFDRKLNLGMAFHPELELTMSMENEGSFLISGPGYNFSVSDRPFRPERTPSAGISRIVLEEGEKALCG